MIDFNIEFLNGRYVLVHEDGSLREATKEEVALWDQLCKVLSIIDELNVGYVAPDVNYTDEMFEEMQKDYGVFKPKN